MCNLSKYKRHNWYVVTTKIIAAVTIMNVNVAIIFVKYWG